MIPLQPATITPESRARTIESVLQNVKGKTGYGAACAEAIGKPCEHVSRADVARFLTEQIGADEIWKNDVYQVNVRRLGTGPIGELVHLSIKRLDREPVTDWRDKQAIKNQLCGPESEGLELYPAESRVVDTANQYHLWVLVGGVIPVGFDTGLKLDAEDGDLGNAKQRAFAA